MSIRLADTSDKQNRIVETLDAIKTDGDEWSARHDAQTAQKYKLEIMSKQGSPKEQRKFMYDNVGNPDFRKKLLQMAWDEANYDEVLRLAKKGLPTIQNGWVLFQNGISGNIRCIVISEIRITHSGLPDIFSSMGADGETGSFRLKICI